VLKSFLAENNLPEMLGKFFMWHFVHFVPYIHRRPLRNCTSSASILLDNAVNKAKLLTLTEEECDNLGLGVRSVVSGRCSCRQLPF